MQQPESQALLNSNAPAVAESSLSWLDGSGLGFSLEYPTISLHAVSRDLNAYPREHLYVMVNAKFGEESKESVAEEEADSDNKLKLLLDLNLCLVINRHWRQCSGFASSS